MAAVVPRTLLVTLVGCALAACSSDRKGGEITEVTPGAAARIELSADTLELRQGSSASISARVLDADGREVPGATVQFSAAPSAAAAVSVAGVVQGRAPGGATLRAQSGTVVDSLHVDVIGHPEGLYVGSGEVSARPFGAAVSRKGVALVTRLDAASVAVVDIVTRRAVGTIGVGFSPTGVTFDREGDFAYVTNQHSQSIGVIDVAAREQVDEIAIGGDPFVVRVSPDGRKLFVSSNTSFVHIVDLQGRAVVDSVEVGYAPNGFAVDPSETKLYVSSFIAGTVAEIDIATSEVLRHFQVSGMPQEVIVSADGSELYVANEAGRVDVWDLGTGERAASVPLAGGAFGMALSPDEAHLYVSIPEAGWVQVVNTASRSIVHTVSVSGQPRRIAFDYHGGTAVVANEFGAVDFVR